LRTEFALSAIGLSPKTFNAAIALFDRVTDGDGYISGEVDRYCLTWLRRKGVVEGTIGRLRLLVSRDQLYEQEPSARGRNSPVPPAEGVMQIPASMLPLDRDVVLHFLDATSSASQREYEKRRQDGVTSEQVSAQIKGLRGPALIAKLHEIEDASEQTFDQFLRLSMGFSHELITILGIAQGHDTADQRTQRGF
jgi:hypothetical protein